MNVDPNNNQVEEVLQTVNYKVDNISASLLLRQAYDEAYVIYDHLNAPDNVPFPLVKPHEKEDVFTTSQFGYYSRRFKDYSVNKYFGLNLLEFMSLPRHEAEDLLRLCQEAKKADNAVVSDLENEFNGKK